MFGQRARQMDQFKIAAAQVASVRGDLKGNIHTHAAAIVAAAEHGISVLVFPELSLIGYEPDLAAEMALEVSDARMTDIADLAEEHQMHVVVGAPLSNGQDKPALGAILFRPDGLPLTYAKMHLGGSELTYFAAGTTPLAFSTRGQKVGLSICADSSCPSHPTACESLGATIYAAGMFLNAQWYAMDAPRLAGHASQFGMLVVMANHADSSVARSTTALANWLKSAFLGGFGFLVVMLVESQSNRNESSPDWDRIESEVESCFSVSAQIPTR